MCCRVATRLKHVMPAHTSMNPRPLYKMEEPWRQLLLEVQNCQCLNPGVSIAKIRKDVQQHPVVADEQLEFWQARVVDKAVVDSSKNTHWLQAYGFPAEGDSVTVHGEPHIAMNVGVFTFLPTREM